ncbi:Sugar isomerase domain-containing protein [Desulfonema limicola]|uniref:Glutamine--fructose-6-phosphate aminotransferase [isomerizing] n=1 Tax=Desulfonema limicola TaxID=45656 RepID=A0A975GH06_9BACT|nr:SIS domain-containing protein [Desulfonema limicola]QTA80921.1 Sugar isomerase domain-containing protein [Desulfonema limicola]
MCGIVCYFGGSGNSLTRVLTAMSAIIYRAPDSTGIGLFGDEQEPVRLRKSLGSVSQLINALLGAAAYPNQSAKLMALWSLPEIQVSLKEYQQDLLKFQEHPVSEYQPLIDNKSRPPSIDELTALKGNSRFLKPGTPGRAAPLPVFFIKSGIDTGRLIHNLAQEFDISIVVIRSLFRNTLESYVRKDYEQGHEVHGDKDRIEEILNTFDLIFDNILSTYSSFSDSLFSEVSHEQSPFVQNPKIHDLVWEYLHKIPFQIPDDYDRDGVRCTFRILDAALMCRLRIYPELHTDIQEILESLWPGAKMLPNTDWQTLYQAEKGVNVYGWGAASVMTWLQKNEIFPMLWQASKETDTQVSQFREGYTDPVCLCFLSQPVIAHGRWALQSAVTVKNSHPFHDVRRQRCIVLNGQFSSSVETETRDFLEQVVGMPFRTENSSEYLSLLWGYYFENLFAEKKRYDEIRLQIDTGLDDYHMGSHSIDFKVYGQIREKTCEQLDEMAFLEAVRRMKSDGGQIAAAGISLYSPRRLYVACHNRPAFVVQRADNNDIMIVSDINAALGLFSQEEIQESKERLIRLIKTNKSELQKYKDFGANTLETARVISAQAQAEKSLLEPFRVTVFPLEGEEIFVRLETILEKGKLKQQARIFDFKENILPDIEAFSTVLNPLQISKELYSSFYETHLNQIPEIFYGILRFYISEKEKPVCQDIQERLMERRFGSDFGSLQRIIIAGMGSSYNMGLLAAPVIQKLMPGIDVRVIQPVDIDNVQNLVFPEKDLVLMLSWSATTADMVEFAKELQAARTVMIGITEKVFADMALICNKSGGIIPILSGEEVTISGIKSTLSMLFTLHVFILWLGYRMKNSRVREYAEKMKEIPASLSALLSDNTLKNFATALARKNSLSHACIIIGDTDDLPVSREAALKLEECSWSSIGRAMDFQDVLSEPALLEKFAEDSQGHLLIVNALTSSRMDEALELINMFYAKNVCFSVLAAAHNPYENEIRRYSQNNCFFLDCPDEAGLPFVVTLFYYSFTLEFARARGRKDDEFPRNRAKSVTAGRSRPMTRISAGGELMALARLNSSLRQTEVPKPKTSIWEQETGLDSQSQAYQQIRLLGEKLAGSNPMQSFFPGYTENGGNDSKKRISVLGKTIFQDLKEGGELIFQPFDREAESAARNIACQWQRFTDCPIHVMDSNKEKFHFHENVLVFCIGTRVPKQECIKNRLKHYKDKTLWLGPSLAGDTAHIFRSARGYFTTNSQNSISLYADLCILFSQAWKTLSFKKGNIITEHLKNSGKYINTMLNDRELLRHIQRIMKANQKYHTAFYVGPSAGTGQEWVRRFDRLRRPDMEWHSFGTCAHGPLAAVDNNVKAKYICLTDRNKMILQYGEKKVTRWEHYYLGSLTIDQFLKGKPVPQDISHAVPKPFFAQGDWYIPALQPDYNTAEDNLIILDASRNHYLGHALDELSTLGCRYARIILITQKAFAYMPDKKAVFTHPFSHLIRIPSPVIEKEAVLVSGFIIPFLMDILNIAVTGEISVQKMTG